MNSRGIWPKRIPGIARSADLATDRWLAKRRRRDARTALLATALNSTSLYGDRSE